MSFLSKIRPILNIKNFNGKYKFLKQASIRSKSDNAKYFSYKNYFIAGLSLGSSFLLLYYAYPKHFAKDLQLPQYTEEEVAKHNSFETGIWVSYDQNVYDITQFIHVHPGGPMILMAAGKSLEPFWNHFANHKTKEVYEILEPMKIGTLKYSSKPHQNTFSDPYAMEPLRNKKLISHSTKPFNAETPSQLLVEKFITPNDIFYIRNHLPVPLINPREHTLEIQGLGLPNNNKVSLSLDDLKSNFQKHSVITTISCAGNRRAGLNKIKEVKGLPWDVGAISTSEWSGVYLFDILKHFEIDISDPNIKHVHFEGMDKQVDGVPYRVSVPSSKVFDPKSEVLLAYEMNGEDIPLDHGYPLRVIVPGVTGARNVKWLSKIILSEEESPSHWQRNDYKVFSSSTSWENADYTSVPAIQEMPVNSAICDPLNGATVKPDQGVIHLKGYAWSGGGRGIARVDISIDGGKTWLQAHLSPQSKDLKWAWTLWNIDIPVDKSQDSLEIICKAVDSSYNVQPESHESVWNIRGLLNNAWHHVKINLEHN